jgi:hypothetical protein
MTSTDAAAQRSWFARHKILTALGAVMALFIIAGIASGGGSSKPSTNVADPLTATTTAPPKAAARPTMKAIPNKPNDKGWIVQAILTRDDGLGNFGGTARITNANDGSRTATFTFTLVRAGKQIATLQGSAQDVAAGKTVTVDLISQDKFSHGAYIWDFQTDVSY